MLRRRMPGGAVPRQRAQRQQVFNALRGGVLPHLFVKRGSLLADFSHVAQHPYVGSGQFAQQGDGGAHRVRIGVVAVVDQGDGPALPDSANGARTALNRREGRKAGFDVRKADASG